MSVRSLLQPGLLPWLLLGALLASVSVNVAQLVRGTEDTGTPSRATSRDPGTLHLHLSAGASDEQCPTLQRLALTSEQRTRIRSCSLTSLDLRTDLAIEIATASQQLDGLLANEAMDNQRALELADRISSLRTKQYKAWISSILVVREVLTNEQLRLLHELESN